MFFEDFPSIYVVTLGMYGSVQKSQIPSQINKVENKLQPS